MFVQVLYQKTLNKEKYVKTRGYKVVNMWEHEYDANPPPNTDQIVARLDPRDSFFGGRTNAVKLHCKTEPGQRIAYADFTSLYPYTNKFCPYPVGHPEVIVQDFRPLADYFGIAKVKIIAPRGLYQPVLPRHAPDGKLHFALCSTCSTNQSQELCTCKDEDRAFVGTWCIPEILKAVEKGYTILKIHEVYHWAETSQYNPQTKTGGLFTTYVNTFLKLKQEVRSHIFAYIVLSTYTTFIPIFDRLNLILQASGWPSWCVTPEDKARYVRDYEEHEGIKLDPAKIIKNPGLRSLAKLMLNSFWVSICRYKSQCPS